MAYKQNIPGMLQKIKLPLFGSYSNRGTDQDKDQRFLNCFPESRKVDQTDITKTWLIKRPGISLYKEFDPGNNEARGLIEFNDKLYAVYGTDVYEDDPIGGGGTPTVIFSMTTSTGPVGLRLGNSSIIGDYLFICDGIDGWYIDTSSTVTQITDVDFPSPHVPTPVFLDGYIVISKGSDIYNCVVDDPSSWDATNFISAESFPDAIHCLARQNNQIVAFGSESTEFFYNAANASGSPFNRNEAALMQIGCAAPYAVTQTEKFCSFIGSSFSGGHAFWIMEGFQPKRVSDEFIDRLLNAESDIVNTSGFCIRIVGHMFYVLNLPTINRTLVYDPEEKLWHEWSNNSNDRFIIDYVADGDNGTFYGQIRTNGFIGYFDRTVGEDNIDLITSRTIPVIFRTNRVDMDTTYRKRLHSLKLFMDQVPINDSPIILTMSDNDYNDIVGNTTFLMYADADTPPVQYRLGDFRRRSFQFEYNSTEPGIRFEAMELSYTEGIS